MNKILLTIIFFQICIIGFGQDVEAPKERKNKFYGGLSPGPTFPKFHRKGDKFLQMPNKNPLLSWRVGVHGEPLNFKRYSLRWELAYVNKGAEEEFKNTFGTYKTKASYSDVQFNLFPVIIKPAGFRKCNPFIGLGAYYSYNVKAKYTVQINNMPVQDDATVNKIIEKQDYGPAMNLGLYINKLSIEYRFEKGLKPLLNEAKANNNVYNALSSIVLNFAL